MFLRISRTLFLWCPGLRCTLVQFFSFKRRCSTMPRIQCLIKAHSMLRLCCFADQVVFQNVDCLSLVYCCYFFLAHVMPTRFRASRGKQCSFSFVVTFSFWCNFLASVQLFLSRVILFCAYSDIKVERKINTEKEKKNVHDSCVHLKIIV